MDEENLAAVKLCETIAVMETVAPWDQRNVLLQRVSAAYARNATRFSVGFGRTVMSKRRHRDPDKRFERFYKTDAAKGHFRA